MSDLINFFKNNKYNIALLAIYIILTVILALNHELWRDETQAWCIARDCNIKEIFDILKIEGHPILWYLVMFPFAKLGFSVYTIQFFGLLFLYSAAILLIFKSPFNKLTKYLILFSSAMLYFFPVVVRNLIFIPVILFILAEIYEKRKAHPFYYSLTLILLSNTYPLITGFCAVTMFIFFIELFIDLFKEAKYKLLAPISILFLNAVYLYFFYNSASSLNKCYNGYSQILTPLYCPIYDFALMFFQYPFVNHSLDIILFYILFGAVIIRLFFINKKIFTIFFFSFLFHFYIYINVWFGGIIPQKAYLLLFILVFCFWVTEKEKKDKILNYLICFIFAINSVFSFTNFIIELKYDFSGAKRCSEYIRKELNDEKIFCVMEAPYKFTSLSAYLPDKKFYSYNEKIYVSYYDFSNTKHNIIKNIPDCNYYISLHKTYDDLIFYADNRIPYMIWYNISNIDEVFYIYKIRKMQ